MKNKSSALSLVQDADGALAPIPRPAASRHPPSVYLSGLGESSRHSMRIALKEIAHWSTSGAADIWTFPWHRLRFEHCNAIRAHLADKYAPATARQRIAALRGVLKSAKRLRQISSEDYFDAIDLPAIRGVSLPPGRAMSAGELRALFSLCTEDARVAGARDGALLALLFGAGPRREEVTALNLKDYDEETGEIRILKGKGSKGRVTYAGESAREAINYWLEIRGRRPGALIMPLTRSGRILRRRMCPQTVLDIAARRAEEAGIKIFTPHDTRRTWMTNLFDNGVDVITIQNLAGHKKTDTTKIYDRRGEAVKVKASETIFLPFARPRGELLVGPRPKARPAVRQPKAARKTVAKNADEKVVKKAVPKRAAPVGKSRPVLRKVK